MISWHKVGQKVVCVDAEAIADSLNALIGILIEGDVYTISEVALGYSPSGALRIGFKLFEVPQAAGYWSCASRFKPVYPLALDRLRELLVTTPETARYRVTDPVA